MYLAELSIFHRVLTAAEVTKLYNSGDGTLANTIETDKLNKTLNSTSSNLFQNNSFSDLRPAPALAQFRRHHRE